MSKRLIATFLALVVTSAATATVTISVDICDAADGIALPADNLVPGGIAMVDVFANVATGTGMGAFTAAGIRVYTAAGVTLRYATDPNTHNPIPVNPGTANRFVTFFSIPRGRDVNARYNNGAAAAATSYSPGHPVPDYYNTEVNVAYFASPAPTAGAPPVAGYIFRVAINLPPNLDPQGQAVITQGTTPPAGSRLLATCVGGQIGDPGVVAATFDAPNVTGIDWNISWTPEPASLLLITLAGFVIFRR